MVTERVFGRLSDGRPVKLYKIENSFGEYVEVCDYGAALHSVCVLDRDGSIGDVVLGCPDVYNMQRRSFKAATIGRCANRIAYGRCALHGDEVQLEVNESPNFLHGGSGNWAFKLFSGSIEDGGVALRLTDIGEGGFYDRVEALVRFSFGDDHRLTIHYELTPERETVLCPTNHAYFNLGGFTDARDMELTLYASNLARRGPSGTPEGGFVPVEGTAFDFREPRALRENMKLLPAGQPGYDDFYVLDRSRADGLAATLRSERTGRVMNAYTDMQSAIIYTPVGEKHPDKSGADLPDYPAVCIECQFVPNAVNVPEFDSPVFQAGEKLITETVYEFLTR